MTWISIILCLVLSSPVFGQSPATEPSTTAPEGVQSTLDAIDHNHDNFLKNYRAVVLVVIPNSGIPVDALDIIWRDGEKVRDDHHLPAVELQDHPTPPLPRFLTPDALFAWADKHEPVAKQLVDGRREYVWFAGSAKAPGPRVQVAPFHEFPRVVNDNFWPNAIQWPSRHYAAADFHLLDANAETPDGCIDLRTGGDGDDRIDFYVDPLHDYICTKRIDWNKRAGKWTKTRVLTLSNIRRINGRIVAGSQRVRSYSYSNIAHPASPEISTQIITIDIVPLAAASYPPGVFDSASLTTGADAMGN